MSELQLVEAVLSPVAGGRVTGVRGLISTASGLDLPVGAEVEIEGPAAPIPATVVGFGEGGVQLMPLAATRGISAGQRVWPARERALLPGGDALLGRVIDPLGAPLDGGPALPRAAGIPLYREPISPLQRPMLDTPLDVGVRSINAATTLARGQRIGLFAGPGVGKSTLLGMMVRGTNADVRVIALIGERGREVREFVDRELGDALASSVVVAVTSDRSPLLRMRGAWAATAIAEAFRDRGRDVLLLVDSITRFAYAAREVGLARGEPATTRGYTPSVFAELPVLLERAGRTEHGSITGIYSVLVEGDEEDDPLAEALRAILDGHIVLSRALAERGHFPAVDVLASVSRAMPHVSDAAHREAAQALRGLLAAYRDAEDLIQVGAYAKGSDPRVDRAIERRDAIEAFLRQETGARASLPESIEALTRALGDAA
ncbi:MAG: FliI/YscN family ATPase [Myxococcota bacterium]